VHLAVGKAARAQKAKENKEEIESMQVVWVEVIAQHLHEHSMHTAVTLSQLGSLGLQKPKGLPKSSTLGKVLEQHGASCGLVVVGKGNTILVHLVEQDSGCCASVALGLKWQCAGIIEPTVGRQLMNAALASDLRTKLEFTQEEWAVFGIADLRSDDYIKSELESFSSYFKPVAVGFGVCVCVCVCSCVCVCIGVCVCVCSCVCVCIGMSL